MASNFKLEYTIEFPKTTSESEILNLKTSNVTPSTVQSKLDVALSTTTSVSLILHDEKLQFVDKPKVVHMAESLVTPSNVTYVLDTVGRFDTILTFNVYAGSGLDSNNSTHWKTYTFNNSTKTILIPKADMPANLNFNILAIPKIKRESIAKTILYTHITTFPFFYTNTAPQNSFVVHKFEFDGGYTDTLNVGTTFTSGTLVTSHLDQAIRTTALKSSTEQAASPLHNATALSIVVIFKLLTPYSAFPDLSNQIQELVRIRQTDGAGTPTGGASTYEINMGIIPRVYTPLGTASTGDAFIEFTLANGGSAFTRFGKLNSATAADIADEEYHMFTYTWSTASSGAHTYYFDKYGPDATNIYALNLNGPTNSYSFANNKFYMRSLGNNTEVVDIDQINFYNKMLSPTEVEDIFNYYFPTGTSLSTRLG